MCIRDSYYAVNCVGGIGVRYRDPDDVAPGRLEMPYLVERRLQVARVGVRHRLHSHRGPAADRDVPEHYPVCHFSVYHWNHGANGFLSGLIMSRTASLSATIVSSITTVSYTHLTLPTIYSV